MRMLLLLTLLVSGRLLAAAPPIYPGEPGSESSAPIIQFGETGCLAAWFYDAGHRWQKAGFWGTGDDCVKANAAVADVLGISPDYIPDSLLGYALAWKLNNLTHAQKDKLWNDIFVLHPGDPGYDAVVTKDAPMKLLYDVIPYPKSVPPSGYVTTAPTVYYAIQQAGKMVMLPVGTVPLGTRMDTSQQINGYYAVDTSVVKWFGNTRPLIVFAK